MSSKVRIGVLGASEIAFRRFVPAILRSDRFEFVGIAHVNEFEWCDNKRADQSIITAEREKANNFKKNFGGKIFESYNEMIYSDSIDAIYIPLPPALHFKWGEKALKAGKHILLEKPFTTCLSDTRKLIKIAKRKKLAVHENFAFAFHKQIDVISDLISKKEIGDVRLIKASFGFPYRGEKDFRYKKSLGGGALLDCGGYPLKLASILLGESGKVVCSQLSSAKEHDVDVYGSATLVNNDGLTAQISFGMDNAYRCELEIWGSDGFIIAPRVFTPPADMKPTIIVRKSDEKIIEVCEDDQFQHSAELFADCIENTEICIRNYNEISKQSKLFEDMKGRIYNA